MASLQDFRRALQIALERDQHTSKSADVLDNESDFSTHAPDSFSTNAPDSDEEASSYDPSDKLSNFDAMVSNLLNRGTKRHGHMVSRRTHRTCSHSSTHDQINQKEIGSLNLRSRPATCDDRHTDEREITSLSDTSKQPNGVDIASLSCQNVSRADAPKQETSTSF
jgi:hypothetical protein